MFGRRNKISWSVRLREFVWPRSGWRRSTEYLRHRVFRLPGTPYALAAGAACGAAISFTPFVGFHFVLAALLAWLLRANIVASAVGTAVGNPWTFPFIWLWVYEFGTWMGVGDASSAADVDFTTMFAAILQALLRFDMMYLLKTAWPVMAPMLAGSIPTALVVWFSFYLAMKPMIASYHHHRLMKRRRGPRMVKKQERTE
ncbi:MAG: DUF2062 domain-containing protein [Rhodospirillales bacterium]|nr:DUF2062 domain-containing protein [Rhodospirillales bacterium]